MTILHDPNNEARKHPIMIAIAENEEMGAFDLQIFVGNFKNEAAATEYADQIKEFLEENADAEIMRAQ